MESLRKQLLPHDLTRKAGHQSPRHQSAAKSRDGEEKNGPQNSLSEVGEPHRQRSAPRLRGRVEIRKNLLLRLAAALHGYGNSAPRTEYLVERAARRLGVDLSIAVFPSLVIINFVNDDKGEGEASAATETRLINAAGDMDVDKLGRVDELANQLGTDGHSSLAAFWRLKAIASAPPPFGTGFRVICFGASSATAAVLLFKGSLWDGLFSFLLGLAVGGFDILTSTSPLLESIVEFITATCVSFFARLVDVYMAQAVDVCYFAMALSALVGLLPGLQLTMGVSELVAKSYTTGSSRLVSAMFSALQLGFGLSIGEGLVFWVPRQIKEECPSPDLSFWWNAVWFTGYAVSTNVLLQARISQWPGMTLAALAGYAMTVLTSEWLDTTSATVAASFTIGVTGAAYAKFSRHLPLSMVLTGILLLVPGGLGVLGMAAMMDKDIISGMGFVFQMLVVGLSITLGLLLAKLTLPHAIWGQGRVTSNARMSLVKQLEEDREMYKDELSKAARRRQGDV